MTLKSISRRMLLSLSLLPLLICGCTDVKQINRITFVTALGVEKSEVGVKVHAVLAIPNRFSALSPGGTGGNQKSPNYILTEEGRDVSEALFKMKRDNSRDIQFGHNKIILFSEEIAKDGLDPYLDLFMRRSEFQPIAWIALTKDSPRDVLETVPQIPDSTADLFIDVFSQAGTETAEILPIYLYEFYSLSVEPGQTPFAMYVQNLQGGNHIEIGQLGVFRGDKLVGSITSEETMYLQMLQNNPLHNTIIDVPDATAMALNYKTTIHATNQGINISLHMDLDIDELHGQHISTPTEVSSLEREITEELEQNVSRLVKKLQAMHADPAGIGNEYRKHLSGVLLDYEAWNQDIFPEIPVTVTARTKIVRRGTIEY
ncbi:Ger(x)C family spore germination protein [Paenibacillus hexagrammi]|uniref:Ger(X)C family spore germination protein n=1 Tax=Paenibacillus hexagrammi TaxID=2908839 RepID=A0ABY3SDM1_9BACL|nr:Ger(x)C family spore germination protein [Paenibacillus sp. YPD9-1]UJF31291.1 Ger(x)C family spore germination protein [Paenibacillus sp. YPD9-1]